MRQTLHLFLFLMVIHVIACNEETEDIALNEFVPSIEELPDSTINDVFTVECANYAPDLYLFITDKDGNSILDCNYPVTGIVQEGKIAIKQVSYVENIPFTQKSDSISIDYHPTNSMISIRADINNTHLSYFHPTKDTLKFYGKRPLSGIADSIAIPISVLKVRMAIKWTNAETDTFDLCYKNGCGIQLSEVFLQNKHIGYNEAILIKAVQ